MQKRFTSLWVTTFTLIALVLSGVAPAASLLSEQSSISHAAMSPADHQASPCEHHELTFQTTVSQTTAEECCGSDNQISAHKCCPVSNLINYSVLTEALTLPVQLSSLLLISRESLRNTNSVVNSPYRPPIA